jgi:hypothetical protein
MESAQNNEGSIKVDGIKVAVAAQQPPTAADVEGRRVVRVVVISDTHNQHGPNYLKIPDGDVLVHCGDFTHKSTSPFPFSLLALSLH